jgi:hypothetical protein
VYWLPVLRAGDDSSYRDDQAAIGAAQPALDALVAFVRQVRFLDGNRELTLDCRVI